jgi:beta-glucosidase-like glycosyl hydrolase
MSKVQHLLEIDFSLTTICISFNQAEFIAEFDSCFSGMDINCGSFLVLRTKSALEQGKIQEEDINRALFNLFSVQLRLGLFDKASGNQWFTQLGPSNICTKEHRKLAVEAARQGTVLLKNDNNFLPLKRSEVSHIAIIGPAASDAYIMGGDYTGLSHWTH